MSKLQRTNGWLCAAENQLLSINAKITHHIICPSRGAKGVADHTRFLQLITATPWLFLYECRNNSGLFISKEITLCKENHIIVVSTTTLARLSDIWQLIQLKSCHVTFCSPRQHCDWARVTKYRQDLWPVIYLQSIAPHTHQSGCGRGLEHGSGGQSNRILFPECHKRRLTVVQRPSLATLITAESFKD